jgi:hypothetical protein
MTPLSRASEPAGVILTLSMPKGKDLAHLRRIEESR